MEILIIFLLTVLNGVLAMSEIAVVSARKARLQQQADDGNASAVTALEMAENPNRFLSTVQIGITLIGIIAGTLGGATVADDVAAFYAQVDFLEPYSGVLGAASIIALTTYLSLVVGELVPKRLGIQNPERVAMLVSPTMQRLSVLTSPLVWFLSLSTEGVLRLLGVRDSDEASITEEEIQVLMEEGLRSGVFAQIEHEVVAGVFRFDELHVSALMTPRVEITWININDDLDAVRETIAEHAYSRYPLCDGTPDKVIGILFAKDLLLHCLDNSPIELSKIARRPMFIPESLPAARALDRLRGKDDPMAIVIGEHGGTEGILTINDLVEAVMGDIDEPDVIRREDGSLLIDGLMPIEEFKAILDIKELPQEEDRVYQTLAGFIVTMLGDIPSVAEHFTWGGYSFEVLDMDGKRIDKVMVSPVSKPPQEQENG